MLKSICPHCHNEFSYYPSMLKKYCSRKCQSDASRITTNCPECGKKFWCHKSWPRKYCSRKCSAANNAVGNLGKYAKGVGFIEIRCDSCGKLFNKRGDQIKIANFCSQKCYGVYLSKTRKGIPRPSVRGEKPQLQNRVDINCIQCGKVFQTKQSHKDRRKFCSKACYSRWLSESGDVSGEKNFNWQGGHLPYYGPNWHQQKRNARARDKYTCRRCGITEKELGRSLDVHHIKRFRKFSIKRYKEANTLDNLMSLCPGCHKIVEHHGL